jgi:hypothetical protein
MGLEPSSPRRIIRNALGFGLFAAIAVVFAPEDAQFFADAAVSNPLYGVAGAGFVLFLVIFGTGKS